jgi:uncharacterized protein (DUF1810 family)
MADLHRFKNAQESDIEGFAAALSELEAGQKRSHWIWYIFPQLAGLGASPMAVRFGVQGTAEAAAYLRDPVLRDRLLAVTVLVARQLQRPRPPALESVMGSRIDAVKLVSSLTLFGEIARRLDQAEPDTSLRSLAGTASDVLDAAARQGYEQCAFTLRELNSSGHLFISPSDH